VVVWEDAANAVNNITDVTDKSRINESVTIMDQSARSFKLPWTSGGERCKSRLVKYGLLVGQASTPAPGLRTRLGAEDAGWRPSG